MSHRPDKSDHPGALHVKGVKLVFVLDFRANPMNNGSERVVNGWPEENLGVRPF